MGRSGGAVTGLRLTATVFALVVVTGCGGHPTPLSGPGATPAARTSLATIVDVCGLVSPAKASRLLERELVVVGRTVGASRSPSVECELGARFGEALVTVTLAPDPVALDVFNSAYGNRAGGNPTRVQDLGDAAFVRTEDTLRVLHVFVHGAVLSVSVVHGTESEETFGQGQLTRLTRAATDALPENPAIESSTAPRTCRAIDATVLAQTLGRSPTLDAGLELGNGSLICSWSGQPGSVTLSLSNDSEEVARFLDQHPLDQDIAVQGVLPAGEGLAYSSPRQAGDLVVLVGRDRLMTLQVIPAAGYAAASIDTSDGERAVAKAALRLWAGLD